MDDLANPWHRLPQTAPFVLPEDTGPIARLAPPAREELRLHLDLLPEPFLGNPDAPVVLLGLNPGYSPGDLAHHQDPHFAEHSRDNLLHRPSDYPFYLLDPGLTAPGRYWWERRLGPLIRRAGREAVARGVLCVEYFPYHSVKVGHRRLALPSQQYGFHLVRRALGRSATVLLLRSRRLWFDAVPELAAYGRLHALRSVQNTTVSPNNCPEGFEQAVGALEDTA